MGGDDGRAELVLVLTPTGRDSNLVCRVLQQGGFCCKDCINIEDMSTELARGAGASVIAEEALQAATLPVLTKWLKEQPPWSDFPFVVLTSGGESTRRSLRGFELMKALGNVTLLERPIRTVTLASAVHAALRGRRRQYEAQSYIDERLRAEEALVRQADELVRSNADLRQFGYVTSHDLQEPLRTIHVFSELLQQRYMGSLDGEADKFLGYITESAAHMELLISDLLSYSRLVNEQSGRVVDVALEASLDWALQNLRMAIADTEAVITHDDLPVVRGDAIQLVQLLQNLISNAIKYRSEKPPRIHIQVTRDSSHWTIAVQDNGAGIPPAYQDLVFKLFKRLHGKDIPGTGIGLTICRKIVEKHGGQIWVESNGENGSTFCFTLPCSEAGANS